MDNLIDVIYDIYWSFILKEFLSYIFTYNHLHYTFQFVINISQISITISTGQLRAIQFLLQ